MVPGAFAGSLMVVVHQALVLPLPLPRYPALGNVSIQRLAIYRGLSFFNGTFFQRSNILPGVCVLYLPPIRIVDWSTGHLVTYCCNIVLRGYYK